jgi:hypothetical protein
MKMSDDSLKSKISKLESELYHANIYIERLEKENLKLQKALELAVNYYYTEAGNCPREITEFPCRRIRSGCDENTEKECWKEYFLKEAEKNECDA